MVMNNVSDNTLLLGMVRSALFMFYLIAGVRQIIFNKEHCSYLNVMGSLLLLWSLELFKDAISQFYPWFVNPYVRNLYMLFDLFAIPLCAIYVWTMLYSNWLTPIRLVKNITPFILCFVVYAFFDSEIVYYSSFGVVGTYSVYTIFHLNKSIRAYDRLILTNYSYREDLNIDWLKIVIVLFLVDLLFCLYLYFHPSVTLFCIYYVYCLLMWCYIIYKSDKQKYFLVTSVMGITDEGMENTCDTESVDTHPKWETDLVYLFENEKLFLQSCLSIKDVATRIGTNRSYLSAYLNSVKNTTFYDFVNNYRLEYARNLLHDTNKKVMEICNESGFNSFATFARVFKKKYGYSPKEFRLHC
jgi:AraC-like DNA-binding protein